MSEETTKSFENGESFEARVLSALADIKSSMTSFEVRLTSLEQRLTSLEDRVTSLEERVIALEEKVDSRLHDTRPIWEAVLTRLDLIDAKMDALASEMLTMRGEINLLKKRVPPAA